MRRLTSLASLALVALSVVACGEIAEPAAASVGGHTITVGDVADALAEFEASPQFEQLAEQGDAAALRRTFEQNFLQQEIRRRVLGPEAEERGVEVTEADVDARIEQIKSEFPNQSAFEEALREQGYDMATLVDLVRDSLLEERLRAVVVEGLTPSEADLRARYEEDSARFTEYLASHILVTANPRAVDLAERLQAASTEELDDLFARLARRFSKDPGSGENGGDLGWSAATAYVEPFARALEGLDVGDVSDPVRTDFGFHVIYLRDVRVSPFEQVREQLRTELAGTAEDEAWAAFVRDAYERAAVDLNPRYGSLDLATGLIGEADPGSRPGAATPPAPQEEPTDVPEPPG